MKPANSKKGISLWISFVLLMGFVVVVSAILANWMTAFTKSSSQDIKQRVYDTDICESISLSIDACKFNILPKNLYINITNRHDLNIDSFTFRLYQGDNFEIQDMNLSNPIKPLKTRLLQINASNITSVDTVQAIPSHFKDGFIVVCTKRVATTTVLNCT